MTEMASQESATGPATLQEAYEDLLQWERDSDVYSYQIDGVPIWRLVRNSTVIGYNVALGLEDVHRREATSLSNLLAIALGTLGSVWDLLTAPKADVLFWGSPRRQLLDGSWTDPLTDPIVDGLEGLGLRSVTLERPLQGRHASPAATRKRLRYDAPKVFARMSAKVPVPFSPDDQATIAALADILANRFDQSAAHMQKRLMTEVKAFRAERLAAKRVLLRAQPQAVVVVNRWINSGVLAACVDLAIPAFELQHGAVGEEGFKYYTPYSHTLDPSGFLTFGEHWNSSNWGLDKKRVHNIGAANIWSQREKLSGTGKPESILLVSQPNLANALNFKFDEICRHFPDEHFLLQLHPQDRENWKARYSFAALPNVDLAPWERPLYSLFKDCKAVIGQDSTVLLEASFFNLKVGLLDLPQTLKNSIRSRIGARNFFEAATVPAVKAMLGSTRANEAESGNGFFDGFDIERVAEVLKVAAQPTFRGTSGMC